MGSLTSAMEISIKKPKWVYPKSLGLTPSQRWGHSACYFHGVVYIFGGCYRGLHFSDVLALNMSTMTWTTLATTGTGPGPRDSHSALVVGNKMVVFGGADGMKKVNELHMLDLLSKEWSKPICSGTPPTPRESHTSTLIGDDRLVVFGGSGEGEEKYLNDLYVLDLKSMRWSLPEVMGEIPVPRDSHGSVGIGNRMFVYGGDCGNRYNGDVDVFDTASMTWSRMGVQGSLPGVRAGHAMVNLGPKIYVLGGVGDKCYYNDVWVIDVSNNSWSQLELHGRKPQGRFSHTAVFNDSDIVIYGGCGDEERSLDELLVLKFGASYASACKLSKGHCNGKMRFPRDVENKQGTATILFGNKVKVVERKGHEIDLELKPSARYGLDLLHPKRRRTSDSKISDIETDREDSLQLTHNSFSSQSNQEQATSGKKVHELISHEFLILKHGNHITRNLEHGPRPVSSPTKRIPSNSSFMGQHQPSPRQDQFTNAQQRSLEAMAALNMVGSEVHGKVDAAFDSGYLMTAVVNGRIFRGVLFSPAPTVPLLGNPLGQMPSQMPSSIPVAVPIHYSNSCEVRHLKHINPTTITPSRHRFQSSQMSWPHPLTSKASSRLSVSTQEKVRCDLKGVVLSLGGPGSSLNDP